MHEEMTADLNKTDNLPVIGVISSGLGLSSVKMYIVQEGEQVLYKEANDFFNDRSYSFSEKLDFGPTYESFLVEAYDRADRVTRGTLPFELIPIKEAPVIVFDPEKISYDEMYPAPIPNTTFLVTSTAGLKTIEMSLITTEGMKPYSQTIEFNNSPPEYAFNEKIDYDDTSRGFRVKVTDVYGQIRYGNLEVEYRSVPGPEMSIETELISSDDGQEISLPIQIRSVAGVKKLEIFHIEKGVEILTYNMDYNGENELDIRPQFNVTELTTAIRVVVTDRTEKARTDEKRIPAIIGLDFVLSYQVGSQRYAAGIDGFPGVYPLFSFRDMTGYSVDDALGIRESSIDVKFYMFGGSAVPRVYAMDGGASGTKNDEFIGKNGKASDFTVMNATRLLLLPSGYDFDQATVEDIRQIIGSQITQNVINPVAAGDVIAFRTAATSSAGGGRIGIMKVSRIVNTNPSVVIQGEFTISVKIPQ
ncbi:MAG: hypothetical protein LUE93_14045 [Bacteroides sp.]|nr:hypothetical protein [Bacteroides sp.]